MDGGPEKKNLSVCHNGDDEVEVSQSPTGLHMSPRDRLKSQAHNLIWRAIRDGVLPRASTLKCVDCGKQARDYDHRDLREPLKVEPVCHGCNIRRGPALPPLGPEDQRAVRSKWTLKSLGFVDGGEGEGFSPLEAKLREDIDWQTVDAQLLTWGSWYEIAHSRVKEHSWKDRAAYFQEHDPWA